MQAYATAERLSPAVQLRSLGRVPHARRQASQGGETFDPTVIEGLLGRFADLVVERLMERIAAGASWPADEWLDARDAAEYIGVHRDTIRKLAAQRAIPVHQDGPGCKLFFRRDELDGWRRSSKGTRRRLRAVS